MLVFNCIFVVISKSYPHSMNIYSCQSVCEHIKIPTKTRVHPVRIGIHSYICVSIQLVVFSSVNIY